MYPQKLPGLAGAVCLPCRAHAADTPACCWRMCTGPACLCRITGSAKIRWRARLLGRPHAAHAGGATVAAPAWFTAGWPATPLDGELWAGRGRFAHAQSTTASSSLKTPPGGACASWSLICPRMEALLTSGFPRSRPSSSAWASPGVQAVAQKRVANDGRCRPCCTAVRAGGEGLMLHRAARCTSLAAATISSKSKPRRCRSPRNRPSARQGRHARRMGALLVEMPSGQRFRLGRALPMRSAWRHPGGSWVTYRFRGTHDGGLPRLPALCGCAKTCRADQSYIFNSYYRSTTLR